MYYRRKILLSLLHLTGGRLEALKLQKLLFLFCERQAKPAYEFVPYMYGCFSFQANADLSTLTTFYKKVKEDKNTWELLDSEDYFSQLNAADKTLLKKTLEEFAGFNSESLIKYTYTHHPWYSIRSKIADKYLSSEELDRVKNLESSEKSARIFTIGYEGKTLEGYINLLLQNGVKALFDVRQNAFSQKYGFSKSQLKNACEGVGIAYLHFPEMGVPSAQRKGKTEAVDFTKVFFDYSVRIKAQKEDLLNLTNTINQFGRVALTCFEKDACDCHRSRLTDHLLSLPGSMIEVQHL
jgi:uncharacterized protein (DUF488 family)